MVVDYRIFRDWSNCIWFRSLLRWTSLGRPSSRCFDGMSGESSCEPFSSLSSTISSSSSSSTTLPFSQSVKPSVLVSDVGLVGAVEGGVAGPEALGMVERRCHGVNSKIRAVIWTVQDCRTKVSITRILSCYTKRILSRNEICLAVAFRV